MIDALHLSSGCTQALVWPLFRSTQCWVHGHLLEVAVLGPAVMRYTTACAILQPWTLCARVKGFTIAACVLSSMGMDMPCTVSGTTEIEVSQGLNGNVGESSALDEFKFSNQKCPIFI